MVIDGEEYEVASLLEEPEPEEVYPKFEEPPPQEPEETDDGYAEDWLDSALYKYVRDIHHDKLVKKGLMDPMYNAEGKQQRPATPASQLGMSAEQKYQYNLNPE